jgi:hypothetical protein
MERHNNLRKLTLYFITSCLIILVIFQLVFAGTAGKIAGKVRDAKTNESLPGANIIIEGTTYGAAADNEGDYFIINVPPGIYNLKASMMGYEIYKITGVGVGIDKTTIINFSLNPTVIEGSEVVVVAEKPVIQADIANTQTVLAGDQIASIPVFQFKDVLDKQVGIRDADERGLLIRGEREYAVSLRIDGLETRDHVDNQIETRVNPDAVQEANVVTGGFSAEYGDASAGVVNVILKEGTDEYEATFDGMYGTPGRKHFGPPLKHYWDIKFDSTTHWERLANDPSLMTGVYEQFLGKPELLRELYLWRMRDEVTNYGDKPDLNFRGTFGGPVPFLKNTYFFLSGRYEKVYYLFNQAVPYYMNTGFTGKITSHITNNLKLSFTERYMELSGINRYDRYDFEGGLDPTMRADPSQTRENRYVFENVEDVAWTAAEQAWLTPWPYVDRMSISNRFKNQYGLKLTHQLSPKTFYEVSLLYNDFRIYGGPPPLRDTTVTVTLKDDQGNTAVLEDEYALAPAGYWYSLFNDALGMDQANINGGTHGNYETSRDRSFNLTASITSQINSTNQINAGFDFSYVDLKKDERRQGSDNRFYWWDWHVFPKTLAAWIQDKLEFEGMVANLGLRLDVRIPHHRWMNMFDDSTRYDYHWSDNFREGYLLPDSIAYGPHYRPPVKAVLSPRLSISHPIGTAAKIYFNYSHQNQNPPYEYLYRVQLRANYHGGDYFGNPELPYFKNIQYEVGYEQSIADVFFVAISGYYRNSTNRLANVQYIGLNNRIGDRDYQTTYSSYAPDLYTSGRGLEIRLEKRIGEFWTGWFNYNYEIFTGGMKGHDRFNENPNIEPHDRNYASTNTRFQPMPRFNVGLDLRTPARFGPVVGNFQPLADMRLSVLFWWRSQPAFTYDPSNLAAPYDPRYNKHWKAHRATNLTFSKRFDFGTFVTPVLYIQIYNVFNDKNMFRGAFTNDQIETYCRLLEEHGGKPGEREDLARQAIANQPNVNGPGTTPYDLFLNPRQIFLGFRLEIKQ